ncbi:uncharacterized protein V6R79_016286 [Siganus canaliculatus]
MSQLLVLIFYEERKERIQQLNESWKLVSLQAACRRRPWRPEAAGRKCCLLKAANNINIKVKRVWTDGQRRGCRRDLEGAVVFLFFPLRHKLGVLGSAWSSRRRRRFVPWRPRPEKRLLRGNVQKILRAADRRLLPGDRNNRKLQSLELELRFAQNKTENEKQNSVWLQFQLLPLSGSALHDCGCSFSSSRNRWTRKRRKRRRDGDRFIKRRRKRSEEAALCVWDKQREEQEEEQGEQEQREEQQQQQQQQQEEEEEVLPLRLSHRRSEPSSFSPAPSLRQDVCGSVETESINRFDHRESNPESSLCSSITLLQRLRILIFIIFDSFSVKTSQRMNTIEKTRGKVATVPTPRGPDPEVKLLHIRLNSGSGPPWKTGSVWIWIQSRTGWLLDLDPDWIQIRDVQPDWIQHPGCGARLAWYLELLIVPPSSN